MYDVIRSILGATHFDEEYVPAHYYMMDIEIPIDPGRRSFALAYEGLRALDVSCADGVVRDSKPLEAMDSLVV